MVGVFKTKEFAKWAKKEKVTDDDLSDAICEVEQGQVEASLGGRLFKKRVALGGKGKRGGARLIVAYIANDRSFFIYGFVKNETENITDKQKDALKMLARQLLAFSEEMLNIAIKTGVLCEVKYDDKKK